MSMLRSKNPTVLSEIRDRTAPWFFDVSLARSTGTCLYKQLLSIFQIRKDFTSHMPFSRSPHLVQVQYLKVHGEIRFAASLPIL